MKKTSAKMLCIGLTFFLLLSANVFAVDWSQLDQTGDSDSQAKDEYILSASNGILELYGNQANGNIQVVDTRTNIRWEAPQNVTDEELNNNSYLKSHLDSSFLLYYTSARSESGEGSVDSCYSDEASNIIFIERENGLQITYEFESIGITVSIAYSLDEGQLYVDIPASGIIENGDFFITGLDVLPFFGAATDQDDGYVFYPDGSGAISYFKQHHPQYYSHYKGDIYGKSEIEIVPQDEQSETDSLRVYLPVFAMKKNGGGFFAEVTKGECDCSIVYDPSGYQTNLYKVYSSMTYRRFYTATQNSGRENARIEKNMIASDRQIIYHFLEEKQTSYSQMAASYRKLLLKRGTLQKSISARSPILLQFFMSALEQQALTNKVIAVTTFKQVQTALEELKQAGLEDLNVNLLGWEKSGYGAGTLAFPANGAIGGNGGLKKLNQYAMTNNIHLVLQTNLTDADKDYQYVDLSKMIYYPDNLKAYTNKLDQNLYWFSPRYIQKSAGNQRLQEMIKVNSGGALLENLGNRLYYDYNKRYGVTTRADTATIWAEIAAEWKKELGVAYVEGGNRYMLQYADWLTGIADADSGYLFCDEAIPFYQMVVHGSVAYSGEAVNRFYDFDRQVLKMIEYGYSPTFELTWESPFELMDSNYRDLFSSRYAYYKDQIIKLDQIFRGLSEQTQNSAIVDHCKLKDQVYCVTYENGCKVYVNYSDRQENIQGVSIDARDYTVSRGEAS